MSGVHRRRTPWLRPGAGLAATLFAALALSVPGRADDVKLHRVLSVLDYVAGDYGGAVSGGKIVSQSEYDEQKEFLAAARPLVPEGQRALFAELEGLVDRLAAPEEVAAQARRVRDAMAAAHGLSLAPSRRPSFERGQALYAQSCALCHGPDGRAQTERARELDPPPVSYLDPERAASLTPYKVFNTVTFGISDTAMASFEALSEEERWDLAFYVFTLRHQGVVPRAPAKKPSLRALATTPDPALGLTPEEVAWARRVGTYQEAEDPFDAARRLLAAGLAEQDPARAQEFLVDAYLQGFELAEGRVRAADPALAGQVERAFLALRAAVRDGRNTSEAARELRALLDRAEDAVSGGGSSMTLALAASVIVLREGMEAALLIAALLAALRRMRRRDLGRFVHAGWAAAILAGAAAWLGASALVALVDNREAAEGWTSLAAAAVLLYCGWWLHSQSQSARWVGFFQSNVKASGAALFGLAFLAVFREAVETVLFFQALLAEAGERVSPMFAGVGVGAAALAAAVGVVFGLGKRLPAGAFFAGTGVFLSLLAVIFAGKGIHALQVAGTLRPRPLPLPDVPLLGIYGDVVSVSVQLSLLVLLASTHLATRVFTRRAVSPAGGIESP